MSFLFSSNLATNMLKKLNTNWPWVITLALILSAGLVQVALASSGEETTSAIHKYGATLIAMAIILIAAKISSLIERAGQPSVLGELIIGVVLGNLALIGLHWFEFIKQDSLIKFLAEFGVIILLFQIGLESNIAKMKKVGLRAFLVATVGVIAPFALGTYIIGPWLLPSLSFNAYLFLGATLTATSVGITARVFKDLGKLHTSEAQIVLGAAVIDDVMGLIILAVVSAVVTLGAVSFGAITWITAKAILFLAGAIIFGQLAAPRLGKLFSKIHTGAGMKFTLAMVFCLVIAAVAELIGLAPIVGAFAAGLVLDPVHFEKFSDPEIVDEVNKEITGADETSKQKILDVLKLHKHQHVEKLIEPIGFLFVPVFFVLTGMNVRLETMFNLPILMVALGLTAAAFIGKIIAGTVAGKVNKWIVGWGMVPRGEVGLIFASIGKGLGVISDATFSVVVIMVILTTLLTPPILTFVLKRQPASPNL